MANTSHGDLYGDLWVLARDLDPSDGGGNGEPLLDENGQIIPIGYDPVTGDTFPIYLEEGTEGDFEVPADLLDYIQEIELERANIIRSPEQVVANALEEALGKIAAGTEISADASGRIMVDGVLIDSPRECLALYMLFMKAGNAASWTEAQLNAEANLPEPLAALLDTGWNPTGLLAGVFSKFNPVGIDAVITAHTLMGVNEVTGGGGEGQVIEHYGFTDGFVETFDYDRVAAYGDVWIQWYQDMDGDPSDLEAVQRTLLDVIWGSDKNGDGVNDVGTGVGWADEYLALSADGLSFEMVDGSTAGINDWAQSVEDARQVIFTMHEFTGTTQIDAPEATDDVIFGSSAADYIASWGGNDQVFALGGNDLVDAGDGNDTVKGGGGDDRLEGGAGDDVVRGNLGDDTLFRGSGDDRLYGGGGNDRIFGGGGNDVLEGREDDDVLDGGGGDDVLDGGDGNDIVKGGAGTDMLTGGTGSDRFVFRPGDVGTIDTIADFSIAELDVVILSRLDADVTTDADEAFTFIGYAGFTGTAGELRAVDLVGVQRIEGDMDGDGAADLVFDMLGTEPAQASWFAL